MRAAWSMQRRYYSSRPSNAKRADAFIHNLAGRMGRPVHRKSRYLAAGREICRRPPLCSSLGLTTAPPPPDTLKGVPSLRDYRAATMTITWLYGRRSADIGLRRFVRLVLIVSHQLHASSSFSPWDSIFGFLPFTFSDLKRELRSKSRPH